MNAEHNRKDAEGFGDAYDVRGPSSSSTPIRAPEMSDYELDMEHAEGQTTGWRGVMRRTRAFLVHNGVEERGIVPRPEDVRGSQAEQDTVQLTTDGRKETS